MALFAYFSPSKGKTCAVRRDSKYFLRAFAGIGFGLPFVAYAVRLHVSVEETLIYTLGGLMAQELPDALMLALCLLPALSALYLFSGAVTDELDRFAVFMLPRKRSRTRWLLGRFLVAFLFSFLFYTLMVLTVTFGGLLFGAPYKGIPSIMQTVLALLLTCGLNISLFTVLLNLLKLHLGGALAFFLTWAIYSPGQIVAGLLSGITRGLLVRLFPSAQGILVFHDIPFLSEILQDGGAYTISGFTLAWSSCYSLIALVVLILMGTYTIHKYEFTI